jgi:Ca2+-binding RTX toxin-like protein
MADLYKFLVDGATVTEFEQQADGTFAQEELKLNQTLSFDAVTGNVTLTSTFAKYLRMETFHQTADTTDDASLYSKPVATFTALDGTPIVAGGSGGGHHGGADDPGIPEFHQHGGKSDLDGDHNDNDTVVGTDGNDLKHGGFGDDNVHGGAGNDVLAGDAGDDTLSGDLGDDRLVGGTGFDVLHGGSGNDRVSGGDDADVLTGDDGNDTLSGGNGNDDVSGGTGKDSIAGGAGNDHAAGGEGDDTVSGDLGDDTLSGDAGNDKVNGGAGDDTLSGGAGKDAVTGGIGADHFIFADGDFAGLGTKTADRIADFSHAQGDMIDLSGVDADTGMAGDQALTFIGTTAFSHTAGELHLDIGKTTMLLSGDTSGDGIADFAIRIDGTTPIVFGDLVL